MYLMALAVVGIVLSLIGIKIDMKLRSNPNFKAACDLGDWSSCTKTLKSDYSKILFGIPNTYFSLVFFIVIAILSYYGGYQQEIFYGSVVAAVFTGFLSALILIKQKNVCVYCLAMFAVCAALAWLTH